MDKKYKKARTDEEILAAFDKRCQPRSAEVKMKISERKQEAFCQSKSTPRKKTGYLKLILKSLCKTFFI